MKANELANLKPYPAMKDSGLAWVREVPEHWDLAPNRAVLRRRKVLVGKRHTEYQLLSLTKAGVIVRDISSGRGKFSADMGTSQEVRSGDLVFCLFDVPETPRTVGLSPHAGMITGAYTVFECRDAQVARYVAAFYIAMDDRKLLSPLYSGLRNTIPPSIFLGTKTPMPPPAEQASILRYLDHVNRRVLRLVRAKRKLITLLTEQKQAIIHHTIAGARTSAWRSFPAWAVLRLAKRLGHPDKPLLSLFRDYGVIPKASRENKNVDVRDLALCQLVEVGDVVMNKMKAWQGSIAVSDIEGIVSPDYMVLQVIKDGVSPKFLHYLLRSPAMITDYRRQAYGVRPGQWRLMHDEFRQLQIHLPPIEDQVAIVRSIDEAHARISVADDALRRELATLSEYRTRLIADVVTGKLDVRMAAAMLPEVDPLDADDTAHEALTTYDEAEPDELGAELEEVEV